MILFNYSMPHTGSTFLSVLLFRHPDISQGIEADGLIKNSAGTDHPLIVPGNPDLTIGEKFLRCVPDWIRDFPIWQIRIGTPAAWLWPLILYPPMDSKVVVPLRSPWNIMSSNYRRGEKIRPGMAYYLMQLQILKLLPDVYVIPIDILEDKDPDERVSAVSALCQWLGVNMADEMVSMATQWPRYNECTTGAELSSDDISEIKMRIENSDIYNQLELAGYTFYTEERKP